MGGRRSGSPARPSGSSESSGFAGIADCIERGFAHSPEDNCIPKRAEAAFSGIRPGGATTAASR